MGAATASKVYYLILLNNPKNASTGLSMNGKSQVFNPSSVRPFDQAQDGL